jgi:2,3-bisphosphoglycerate-dependent phosphoglycerate mutase
VRRFTGWWDVDLAEQVSKKAISAGAGGKGVMPTSAFTSLQIRAIKTLYIGTGSVRTLWIPKRAKTGV